MHSSQTKTFSKNVERHRAGDSKWFNSLCWLRIRLGCLLRNFRLGLDLRDEASTSAAICTSRTARSPSASSAARTAPRRLAVLSTEQVESTASDQLFRRRSYWPNGNVLAVISKNQKKHNLEVSDLGVSLMSIEKE